VAAAADDLINNNNYTTKENERAGKSTMLQSAHD
jgi:hypothetical protein